MSSAFPQSNRRITREEYLASEVTSEVRHEFYQGEVFAMAGGTSSHSLLKMSVGSLLHAQLQPHGCKVFDSDMRVLVESVGLYTYPDFAVTCEKPQFESRKEMTLLNPQMIVEVLSPSTERYDRGKKFAFYCQIPSLRRYLLVSQEEARIEVFTRQDDGLWSIGFVQGLDAALELPELHSVLKLRDVYSGFDFATAERADSPYEAVPERRPGDRWTDSSAAET